MQETKYLVSLHGAGLTNMLFMHKGGSVLELRKSDDSNNNCYFSLTSALDLNYYYQKCEGDSASTQTANLKVDIQTLKKNIRIMIK